MKQFSAAWLLISLVFLGGLVLTGLEYSSPVLAAEVEEKAEVMAAAGPVVGFETETLELGEAIRGKVMEAEFVYHNTGDQPLRILKAKPG